MRIDGAEYNYFANKLKKKNTLINIQINSFNKHSIY